MYERETFGEVTIGRGAVSKAGTTLRVHVYQVDDALIDTGPATLGSGLVYFVEDLPATVRRVALTHLHEDHCGMAAHFIRRGIPVYSHPNYVNAMARKPRLPAYRRSFWGVPAPFVSHPFPDVFETNRYSFSVIETPGHTDEHVILFEANEGWLFAGDLFIAPRVFTITRHERLPLLMDSIRRALTLDFEVLFCAHAGIVVDGKQALRKRLEAFEDIKGQVRDLAEKGLTIRQVTRRLFPGFQPLTWLSLGEYSPTHVVRSLWPTSCLSSQQRTDR